MGDLDCLALAGRWSWMAQGVGARASASRMTRRLALFAAALFLVALLGAFGPLAAKAAAYDLSLSKNPDRSAPTLLGGQTVSGNAYVFVSPVAGVTQVRFWLDNPARTGTPLKTEGSAPWDFAGTASDAAKSALPYDTRRLANGQHTISAAVTKSAGGVDVLNATFTVDNSFTPPPPDGCSPAPCTFSLQLSLSPTRSSPAPLAGKTVSNSMYVFTSPASGTTRVRFFVDDPGRTGTPFRVETGAPWDLAGGNADGTARPYDTKLLSNAQHQITAEVTKTGGALEIVTATFRVENTTTPPPPPPPPTDSLQLSAAPDRSGASALSGKTVNGDVYVFVPAASGITRVDFHLDDPQRTGTPIRVETGAPWDFAGGNADGTAKPYSTTNIANGSHSITAAVTRSSGTTVTTASFTVQNAAPGRCALVPCSEVKVRAPYTLDWSEDHRGIKDSAGAGTGFTWLDKPSAGTGYIPSNLTISGGRLNVRTTKGLALRTVNSQDNSLAVGIDAPSAQNLITARLTSPPAATGNYEQAGVWFGNDEKNYVKAVVISTPTGTKVQLYAEVADVEQNSTYSSALSASPQSVDVSLLANPSDRTVTAKYRVGSEPETTLGTFTGPGEFFSFDAAGIDPEIGTRSFAGILASHRNGATAQTYAFDDFSVTAQAAPPPAGDLSFSTSSFPISSPTSMAWGPDNRLYVSEMFGKIHAISFNASGGVAADQVISTLGSRLTLGITVDPLSTPSDVILWASHSNPSTGSGQPNAGIVSRLSGPSLATRQDVITGLPRAIANHATNSIHFGPDGKLYLAQGGNTGAGAPNTANTEFGTMAEQPLSAALLVADVRNSSFDGSCHNASDIFGPPPCDVQTYATGLRNTYDFVFHSNGSIYGPDNGLGVTGTFPPRPTAPCLGNADTRAWNQGGQNPGEQPDPLNRIVQGRYYGHPNPRRDECVFKDGSFQGVSAPANYTPPLANLGAHRSANGTIEYTGEAFCGDLEGDLLIANYSVGDNLTRVRLSSDGLSVASMTSLVGGFSDPLPVAQSPDGRIFVGELGLSRVSALTPTDIGCWGAKKPHPAQILDAGGAALGGKLYVVGGKTASAHRSTVDVYDPAGDTWTTVANLPGPAVENPAVTTLDGKLYVFGGSAAAFSGAVTNAAAFDPATGAWTALPPMPTARGGVTAQAIGSKIYVIGGMDGTGASLTTVEVFDAATGAWSAGPPLGTRRDNPASAALGGKIYVFGGRTRNADGSSPAATLNTVEALDPGAGTWSPRASMPTGRRTMAVGLLNGRVQLMGGEVTSGGGAFPQNEEYDAATNSWRALKPMLTPRHGAAAGTIGSRVYVAGGGPTGGFALSNANEAFSFGIP